MPFGQFAMGITVSIYANKYKTSYGNYNNLFSIDGRRLRRPSNSKSFTKNYNNLFSIDGRRLRRPSNSKSFTKNYNLRCMTDHNFICGYCDSNEVFINGTETYRFLLYLVL